jgi:hypothetical protein
LAERKQNISRAGGDMPSHDDIWQAATLLIGVYGREAVEYADYRRSERQEHGDLVAAQTWNLIVSEIEQLMQSARPTHLH